METHYIVEYYWIVCEFKPRTSRIRSRMLTVRPRHSVSVNLIRGLFAYLTTLCQVLSLYTTWIEGTETCFKVLSQQRLVVRTDRITRRWADIRSFRTGSGNHSTVTFVLSEPDWWINPCLPCCLQFSVSQNISERKVSRHPGALCPMDTVGSCTEPPIFMDHHRANVGACA